VLGIKLVLLLAILVAGALGSALPLLYRRVRASHRLLGWGNAFAAGVFLAAAAVHLIPDADRLWSSLGWSYPMATLLAVLAVDVRTLLGAGRAHTGMGSPASGEESAGWLIDNWWISAN